MTSPRGRLRRHHGWWAAWLLAGTMAAFADADTQTTQAPAEAWTLEQVTAMAGQQRQEIAAAEARQEAARQKPQQVSALEDPMLMPAIDHYPFDDPMADDTGMQSGGMGQTTTTAEDNGRYDWSVSVEQRFPFSRLLSYRREAAEAEIDLRSAETLKTRLDIGLQAQSAFFMLMEKRKMAMVAEQQVELTRQFAAAASARYSSGAGSQVDVLRIEVELARVKSSLQALQSEIRSAEAMLNASIGRSAELPVPALVAPDVARRVPGREQVKAAALKNRPELLAGTAEIKRSLADVKSMQAMNAPMGVARVGYASTMAEGKGAMLMLGVSLPLWAGKRQASVAEAQAMERMASIDLEAMKLMVEGDAIAARDQLEAAETRYRLLQDDVIPRVERMLKPTLAAYATGQGSLLAVIEAGQARWNAQAECIMAETNLGLAWARLDRMTGTGWENN